MIKELTHPVQVHQVLKFAENVRREKEELREELIKGITAQTSKILIYKKDEEIRGFMFARTGCFDVEKVIFIQAVYIHPSNPMIGHEMFARVRKWASENGIQWILSKTHAIPKSFAKNYKFKASAFLKRRV